MIRRVIQKALLFNAQDQLLLLRRSPTDTRRPGEWDFPGGMLDSGETFEAGIVREIQEEAGLKVLLDGLVFTKTEIVQWQADDVTHTENVTWLYYMTRVVDDGSEVTLSYEHDDFMWVSVTDAQKQIHYDRHLEVLAHYLKSIDD